MRLYRIHFETVLFDTIIQKMNDDILNTVIKKKAEWISIMLNAIPIDIYNLDVFPEFIKSSNNEQENKYKLQATNQE